LIFIQQEFIIFTMMVREIEVDSESMAEQKLGSYSSRYRFTGKELDPLSGLYDFGARYYDPRLSVWFGVDPLADEYPDWNPFAYTMNNPIRFIDPTGMETEPADGDPIKTVQLEEVVVTAKRIPKPNPDRITPEVKSDNTRVNLVLPVNNPQKEVQPQTTIGVPSQEKLNNAIAINNAEILKTFVADPQKIREGDPLEMISILPVGKIVKGGMSLVKASGWIKRSVFSSLDPAIQKKMAEAIKKGLVAPTGQQGIIKLTAAEAAETGYQFKLKILGKGGDIRIYGNALPNGHIIFDKVMKH
jgi:RHS repeat-associated protein